MIICKLNELKDYLKVNQGFLKVIDFVKNNNLIDLDCGIHDLGDGEYLNLVLGKATENNGVMESHKDFVDVQFMVSGKEKLLYSNIGDCTATTEYNADGDYILYTNTNAFSIEIEKGYCAVLFPEDAHKMFVELGNENSKKAIFKIKIR